VAWGYTTLGKRVLVAVRLGQRERHENWLDLGRDLARPGLRAPWLIVSDGALLLANSVSNSPVPPNAGTTPRHPALLQGVLSLGPAVVRLTAAACYA